MVDDAGYWPRIKSIFDDVSVHGTAEEWCSGLSRHPRDTGLLLAVYWLVAEVDNGGLIQFFDNATGVVAPEAVEGLVAIGMPEAAAAFSTAMHRLPQPYPREQMQRVAHRAAYSGQVLDAIDKQLYTLFESEHGGIVAAMNRFAVRLD